MTPATRGANGSTAPAPRAPLLRFLAAVLLGGLGLLPSVAYLLVGPQPKALGLALAVYACAAALTTAAFAVARPLERVGLCNLVTLLRLVLTAALVAPLAAPGATGAILAVATLALLLDGVDGWLARWQGTASAFGARFDMEVDAGLGLILALNAWTAGIVGPAVLLLGLPRYAFAAAGRLLPWIARPLPERYGRKVVCVVQIAALIALQLPALQGPAATAILILALAALAWSFGRDLLWLWQARS